jgi:indolepyruvate ferredoxin oxidoreductase alpha subunit
MDSLKNESFFVRDAYMNLESPSIMEKDSPGELVAMTGNGAMARGIIEAGAKVVTFYSGAPVNTVVDNIAFVADKFGIYTEASVNEKVAVEIAAGAAIAGIRSSFSTKDLGLNVAVDTLLPVSYSGIKGGMVIIAGDDPGVLTSPTEMDSRIYAEYLSIMGFDPSDPQEAKDMVVKAFEISEEVELPVLFRATAQMCYGRGIVKLGEISKEKREGNFEKNVYRWFIFGDIALGRKNWLWGQLQRLKEISNSLPFNKLKMKGGEKKGIITSGVAYNYVKDTIAGLNIDNVALLKLGCFYPLPEEHVKKLIENVESIMIVEELEPFIEKKVLEIAGKIGKKIEIRGKLTGDLPAVGKYTNEIVTSAISKFLDIEIKRGNSKNDIRKEILETIPPQFPTLCAGCPHAASFYLLKQAMRRVKGDYIVTGDIGCYALGALPPLAALDNMYSMGASIGLANGFYRANLKSKVIACIGDSTVLHAGLPSLVNSSYNKADILVYVLDNRIIAATGHQPSPVIGIREDGEKGKEIDIAEIGRALGFDHVATIDPFDLKASRDTLENALRMEGQRMVISIRQCSLTYRREAKKKGIELKPYSVDIDTCTGCRACVDQFNCAAIRIRNEKAFINDFLCWGCGVCADVCPSSSIGRD